jgi:hypothetical protein
MFHAASVVLEERATKGKYLDSLFCRAFSAPCVFPFASVSLNAAPVPTALICPPIDTFPSFDRAVVEIGPGGAVYAGPIGEDAKLWRER